MLKKTETKKNEINYPKNLTEHTAYLLFKALKVYVDVIHTPDQQVIRNGEDITIYTVKNKEKDENLL